MFNEDPEEDNSATPSQISLDETEEEYRDRSWSNNSEQKGRFEVHHVTSSG